MTAPAFAHVPLHHDTELRQPVTVFDQLAADPLWGIGHDRPQLRLVAGHENAADPSARLRGGAASSESYRRRRFLALVALTLVLLVGARLAGVSMLSFAPAASAAVDESVPTVVVVQPGDSYGAIASRLGVDDPARSGERLRLANGSAELEVGQRLVVDLDSLG